MGDPRDDRRADRVAILGHGASGTAASMRPWVEALGERAVSAIAIDLPKRKAEQAVPVFLAAVAREAAGGGSIVIGGHSYGGRVASLTAAAGRGAGGGDEHVPAPAGLLLLSYPLHRPGAPETWRDRTAHWPAIDCPVLLLSGESDPFARVELLREAVTLLPRAELVTYPGIGHGLAPVLPDAADRAAAFILGLRPSATRGA